MLPTPNIPLDKIPECQKYLDEGSHRRLYRFSPNDYAEMAGIWGNGETALPGDPPGELEVVDGMPDGGKIHDLTGMASAFTPDYAPEEMFEIASEALQDVALKHAGRAPLALRERRPRCGWPTRQAAGATFFLGLGLFGFGTMLRTRRCLLAVPTPVVWIARPASPAPAARPGKGVEPRAGAGVAERGRARRDAGSRLVRTPAEDCGSLRLGRA